MDIKRKKRILLIISSITKTQRGSISIEELKNKMKVTLRNKNFNDNNEVDYEVEKFVEKMQKEKRLFQYNEGDNKYFVVH